MNIEAENCEIKMVVAASATALALGIGALVLCVVPWFYTKSGDDPDDDRKATPIGISIDSFSRSSRPSEENCFPSTGFRTICLRGFDFVKVIIPKTCVTPDTSRPSMSGESVTEEPTTMGFCRDNLAEETRIPVQVSSVQCTNGAEASTRRVSEEKKRDFPDSLKMKELKRGITQLENTNSIADRKSARSSRRGTINSCRSDRKSLNLRYFQPRFANLQHIVDPRKNGKLLDSKMINGESSESRLSPIVEENASNLWSTIEQSSRKMRNLGFRETDRNVTSAQTLSTNRWPTSDSSNNTDESLVATNNGISTFRDEDRENNGNEMLRETSYNVISQENSPVSCSSVASSGASTDKCVEIRSTPRRDFEALFDNARIVRLAIVESQKMTDFLNSKEPEVSKESLRESSRKCLTENLSVQETGSNSITPYSYAESIECSICKKHQEAGKKMSNRLRRAPSFSERVMKRFRRDVKDDATPEACPNVDRSRVNFCKSFTADSDLPTGHSTMKNVGTIGSGAFGQSLRDCDYRWIGKLSSSIDDQPLDLSIRRDTDSSERLQKSSNICEKNERSSNIREKNEKSSNVNENNEKSSFSHRNSAGGAPCLRRRVFRDVIDFLRLKRTASQSPMRSDSIKFYHDPSASFAKSVNENVTAKKKSLDFAEFRGENQCGMKNNSSKSARGRDFPKKFKSVFNFRDRPSDKLALPDKNETHLDTISGKIQGVSREENYKSSKNGDPRHSKIFESPHVEDYVGPCTEL